MANAELTHINQIEGLISQIIGKDGHLTAIEPRTVEQAEVKDKALSKLTLWVEMQLLDLRREYESGRKLRKEHEE